MLELILDLIAKYPMAASVFAVMGVLRAIFKPLFALLQAWVAATPSTKDNDILNKVRESKVMVGIEFLLDWFASVKLPK